MARPFNNLTGKAFGRLSVISFAGREGRNHLIWKCLCTCGTKVVVRGSSLIAGNTSSCGCLQRERTSKANGTHRQSEHPIYNIWNSLRGRCYNPKNNRFKTYGERGIEVCKRWNSFQNFFDDMAATYRPGLTIERKNNDKGYSPSNCHWVEPYKQARNKTTNRTILTPIGPMLLCAAAEASGIGAGTLAYRIKVGWAVKDLFKPSRLDPSL